ncbi:6-phosphogluconolactonase [Palleronia sp. KMU-117]|uniref:6-phosphogluconolactonase n=1 Tax=Palleronia sp. KMU-117 TaxID=3434108 RepID=UPI003D7135B9
MRFVEYPDRDMMMIDVANVLAGEINATLMHEDRCTLAVPGGTTPGPVFQSLCAAKLDWSRVDVLLTDERWVDEGDPRSNARLLRQTLLTNRAAAARFHPFYRAGQSPDEAAPDLGDMVTRLLPVSVLLLGMGADMHTASLFPGADGLGAALASDAPPVLPITAPGSGEARVTLTAPVLDGAMSTHVLVTGAEKHAALERAAQLTPAEAPIRSVWGRATVHWAA